jgi:hypothetical protein
VPLVTRCRAVGVAGSRALVDADRGHASMVSLLHRRVNVQLISG